MRRFLGRLKLFFFPPDGTPLWQRILPYAILGVLTLIVLIAGAYGWDYTNSPEFCGNDHGIPAARRGQTLLQAKRQDLLAPAVVDMVYD